MGIDESAFIRITFDRDRIDGATARALAAICPVDIFAVEGDSLKVRLEQVDECTLCELCLVRAPAGALSIHKLYKDEVLVSRGSTP